MHRGFAVLDAQPFVLTGIVIPAWLHGGIPSAGQQAWGAALLDACVFVAFPSVVSKLAWNVAFRPDRAAGRYAAFEQDRLVLDTRLHPPTR